MNDLEEFYPLDIQLLEDLLAVFRRLKSQNHEIVHNSSVREIWEGGQEFLDNRIATEYQNKNTFE